MKITFLGIKNETNLHSISNHTAQESTFQIKSIKISQNVNNKSQAVIIIYIRNIEEINLLRYCHLIYKNNIIFIGKILNKKITENCVIFTAISEPNQDKIKKEFELDPINEVFNPEKKPLNDILRFNSVMQVFNINKHNDTNYQTSVVNNTIYTKEYILPNKTQTSKCNINIHWTKYKPQFIDIIKCMPYMTDQIMQNIRNNLPKKNNKIGKYIVDQSIVLADKEEYILRTIEKIKKSETWEISTHIQNIKKFDIHLKGDQYIPQYNKWKQNTYYELYDKVNKNNVVYECIQTHYSDKNGNDEYWVKHYSQIALANNNGLNDTLFNSEIGQNIFKQLLKILNCYIKKNAYDYMVSVTGPWEYWAFIEVMDKVQFIDINNQMRYAHVFSYEKIFQYDKKEIKFILYFSEPKQPIQSEISGYTMDDKQYFAEQYINLTSIEHYENFVLQRNYDQNEIELDANKMKVQYIKNNNQETGIQIINTANYNKQSKKLCFELYRKEGI
ncbi:hypothetical protein [Candidatus Cytomitobacter primus]|uniref:Uncharacterized protein n=1 Tax=Candidatus Cytomitobacter primus TaxID=2066024 RepID=A0A5C0UFM7_9PROT|nr:hypothetical protein [Candidatus Cytomitobacter primus]QEK38520.1 hypothetical protein FZC34_01185 [Candidatus Cytomitobacter primus]